MAAVLIPGTVECEILMALDTENIENTLYFEKAGAWTGEEATDLGEALIAWWVQYYLTGMSNSLALRGVKVTDWTTANGTQVIVPTVAAVVGGDQQEAMPNSCAPAITFHTAQRGRSHRGRNYLSGMGQSNVVQNRFLQAWATTMETAYNHLLDVATAQACTWVVASRYSGTTIVNGKKRAVPRAQGITTPVVSASFTDLVVDNLRTRLPNH